MTQVSAYGLTPESFSTDTAVARQVGVFVQDHVEIGDRVHVLVGGRLNSYDDSGLAGGNSLEGTQFGLTGRTGLVYKPRDEVSLYGALFLKVRDEIQTSNLAIDGAKNFGRSRSTTTGGG